jgi:streptogramin lyase
MTRAFLLPFAAASFSLLVFTGSVLTPARGQGRGQSFALPDGPGKDTIQTGQFKEYPVKTPASGPHGLEFDQDGNLWFTANSKGYVGKLDPKTGEITEYKLPADVRDRSRTASRTWTARFGTRSRQSSQTFSSASTSRRRSFRAGSFRAEAASFAISRRPTTGRV